MLFINNFFKVFLCCEFVFALRVNDRKILCQKPISISYFFLFLSSQLLLLLQIHRILAHLFFTTRPSTFFIRLSATFIFCHWATQFALIQAKGKAN